MNDDDERGHKTLESLFADVGFDISISVDELDVVLSPLDHIIIKHTFDCYCYCFDENPKNTDFIDVKKIDGNITTRDVLNELNKIKNVCECAHRYCEFIGPCIDSSGNKSNTQFVICFGS